MNLLDLEFEDQVASLRMHWKTRPFPRISALFVGRESRFASASRLELRANLPRPFATNFPAMGLVKTKVEIFAYQVLG